VFNVPLTVTEVGALLQLTGTRVYIWIPPCEYVADSQDMALWWSLAHSRSMQI
jgi:hypothetical protein